MRWQLNDLLKTTQQISDVFSYTVLIFSTMLLEVAQQEYIAIKNIHSSINTWSSHTWVQMEAEAILPFVPASLSHLTGFTIFFPELVLIRLIFQEHVPSHTTTRGEGRIGIGTRGLIQAAKTERRSRLQLCGAANWLESGCSLGRLQCATSLSLSCCFHGTHRCPFLYSYKR